MNDDSPRKPRKKSLGRMGVREIAKRAGVAPMTVSRTLSNPDSVAPATRARVMEAIEAEGFVPNRIASSMKSSGRIIATVVPPLINSGIAEQVQGMSDECHDNDYLLLLIQGDFTADAEEKAIRALQGWRPAGMILQSFVQKDSVRELLAASGAPIVEISEIKGRAPIDMLVGVSNFETAYAMTMHLAAKGYRRIGFVSTPIHGNDRLQQRRTGYHAALETLGFADDGMEIEVPITTLGGSHALAALTDRFPDIDAIFFS
ncbi:MAG: LacI family DNA-binding transcriptional regulator, partial [Rhizobiaceae bacterium]|nr:LacI family DNA-binding transcriptional regulator [Rhizobiaceae bacterium]